MSRWVYELATGRFLYGGYYEPRFDPATQGVVELDSHPDVRLHRFDAVLGKRLATPEELTAYDDAHDAALKMSAFDGDDNLRAAAAFFRKWINDIVRDVNQDREARGLAPRTYGTAAGGGMTGAEVRAAIIAEMQRRA